MRRVKILINIYLKIRHEFLIEIGKKDIFISSKLRDNDIFFETNR
jgi:hypothetical protein